MARTARSSSKVLQSRRVTISETASTQRLGELYITERIKDLFKTSNGKYVAPQAVEAKLLVDKYVEQIVIIADQRKFVSALIVPAYPFLEEYARENFNFAEPGDDVYILEDEK